MLYSLSVGCYVVIGGLMLLSLLLCICLVGCTFKGEYLLLCVCVWECDNFLDAVCV